MKMTSTERAIARRGAAPVYGTKGAKTGAESETDHDQLEDQETETEDENEETETASKSKSKTKKGRQPETDENEDDENEDSDETETKSKSKTKEKSKRGEDDDGDNELSAKELTKLICSGLTKTLRQELPKSQAKFVTEEGLEAIIAKVHKRVTGDSQKVSRENLNEVMEQIVEAQIKSIRKEKRHVQNADDAEDDDTAASKGKGYRPEVEMITSWREGNLPLHGKQLLNILMHKNINEGIDEADIEKGKKLGEKKIDEYQRKALELELHRGKALTSTGVATGDEFVPTDLSSELQRRFYLASDLAALLAAREVAMPTNPYKWPLSTTRPSFYLESVENTDATGSTPGTGDLTMTAHKLMGMVEASYEVEEDSIIPILSFIEEQLAVAGADAWEHALINGDDTATHQDTDEELLTKSPAFAFKGFRKLANAVAALRTAFTSGGLNEANLRAQRLLMGKYALDPRKLIWLESPKGSLAMQGIANVTTMDKYGPKATILTGELATLFGIPIIGSERMRENLDATGVNGASGNTKTTSLLIRLDRFMTGRRREWTVEVDRNIKSQTHQIVASFRKAFMPIEAPSATIPSVSIGYDITPA